MNQQTNKVETWVFMGNRIVDIIGEPKEVMQLIDFLLSLEGWYLLQLHTIDCLPFYHATLDYSPPKKNWWQRLKEKIRRKRDD